MQNPKTNIFFSFVLTIIISRLLVFILDKTNTLLIIEPHVNDFRIHHITIGLIIILVVGYTSLIKQLDEKWKKYLSILYGIGLGLIIDELTIWLTMQSKYWYSTPVGGIYYQTSTYIIIGIVEFLLGLFVFYKRK